MEKSMLIKKVAETKNLEKLYDGLDKLKTKNTYCSMIKGISGLLFLDNFNYSTAVSVDEPDDYLELENGNNNISYIVQMDDIENVENDSFIDQTFIYLKNKMILQLWAD